MKQRVLNQLNMVLDNNGNPRACGRDNVKKAIQLASELFPGMNYGDIDTGKMNVEMLYLLKKMLELDLGQEG